MRCGRGAPRTRFGPAILGRHEEATVLQHTIKTVIRHGGQSGYAGECVEIPVVTLPSLVASASSFTHSQGACQASPCPTRRHSSDAHRASALGARYGNVPEETLHSHFYSE